MSNIPINLMREKRYMSDIPKPDGAVLRRNAEHECGTPVGQVNVVIHLIPGLQTISFYCNKPRLHTDQCEFIGSQVRIQRNQQVGPSKL
jgi:hypothetical protein